MPKTDFKVYPGNIHQIKYVTTRLHPEPAPVSLPHLLYLKFGNQQTLPFRLYRATLGMVMVTPGGREPKTDHAADNSDGSWLYSPPFSFSR